tara:strand:- start:51353 stop:52084 length:732 start_codon:yes stop_codon:yes gene_type:complete
MSQNKVVLFVYDFPHRKSLNGMQLIKNLLVDDVLVVCAPKLNLKFRQSKKRILVHEDEILNPSDVAKTYGWGTLTAIHNSDESIKFLKKYKPDIGIILGARILSQIVIDTFSKGIVNFHPGVLPENRGLDTVKWAIYNKLPQGVTTHLIDKNIDVGHKIYLDTISIHKEDNIYDISSKLLYLQMNHLKRLIEDGFDFSNKDSLVSDYVSQKAVSDDIDDKVFQQFDNYKRDYKEILKNYDTRN